MYTLANMQDSIKKVEATRAQRMATEPRRMTADEKDALLAAYHPDYKEEGFITLKVGPNKGEKVPTELGYLLESNSRILGVDIDLGDFYHTYMELKAKTKDRTGFLSTLKDRLLMRMREQD